MTARTAAGFSLVELVVVLAIIGILAWVAYPRFAAEFAHRAEYQGVSIASATFGGTSGVTFDFFGVPRDAAGVELMFPGRVVLRYQDVSDTIEVSPGTGKVTIR